MFDSFASTSRLDFIGDWYDRISGRDKWVETDGSIYSSIWKEFDEGGGGWFYNSYNYEVNGQYYEGRFNSATEFLYGESIAIRYNPRNPKRKYASSFRSGREPLILGVITVFCFFFWLILHTLS